jgi:hypothetical protein
MFCLMCGTWYLVLVSKREEVEALIAGRQICLICTA